jgi:hypothetical protein
LLQNNPWLGQLFLYKTILNKNVFLKKDSAYMSWFDDLAEGC